MGCIVLCPDADEGIRILFFIFGDWAIRGCATHQTDGLGRHPKRENVGHVCQLAKIAPEWGVSHELFKVVTSDEVGKLERSDLCVGEAIRYG